MAVGRLMWRTPTGAMLWEIWAQRKFNFGFDALALLAGFFCVGWIQSGSSEVAAGIARLVLISLFLSSYLDLLTSFGYIETDVQKVKTGFPGRLQLKPVSTLRLVLVPMFFGGAALVTHLSLWNQCVLQRLALAGPLGPLWLGAVSVCFFWWMQALSWSLPQFPGRPVIVILVAVLHLLLGLMPLLPNPIADGGRWLILTALLLLAVLTAWKGLGWMRQGAWEGPGRLALAWRKFCPAGAWQARKKFGSAFQAQFWLEWRRLGIVLPGICCGTFVAVFFPLAFLAHKHAGEIVPEADLVTTTTGVILILPIGVSGILGASLGRFDMLQPGGDLPVYIATRPLTNGGFVIAKLAMALASSIVTWLGMLTLGGLWLAYLEHGSLISKVSSISPYGMGAFVLGCVPIALLLILFTWKNLCGGISAGLTGRKWITTVSTVLKIAFGIGLMAVWSAAKNSDSFKAALLHWWPALLLTVLAAKIIVAIAAFYWGLRRNAITGAAIGWIAGGWSVCGLFLAGYAWLVCHALNKPELSLWIGLAGFLLLPLADLAVAPLAMAWNRHR